MKLLILTGMSGSGKTTAFKILEDFGYNCVDNLPVALLRNFVDLVMQSRSNEKVAVGIDIRNGDAIGSLSEILEEMDQDKLPYQILFLDADDDVLIKRYKETRRTHPLAMGHRVRYGISEERKKIRFLKDRADYIIDTSHLLVRDLRAEMEKIFVCDEGYKSLYVTVLSFGYKYGIPEDADLVFDVRFLPNPYYVDRLRRLTGNDRAVQEYVMKNEEATVFLDKLTDLIAFLIPNYIKEGKTELVIGVGCTGGKHRSVTLANALYGRLSSNEGYGLRIEHRDIDKDAKRGK